jgi:hypothetical protein
VFSIHEFPSHQLKHLLAKHRIPRRYWPHVVHYVRTGRTTKGLARLRRRYARLPADDDRVLMFMLAMGGLSLPVAWDVQDGQLVQV